MVLIVLWLEVVGFVVVGIGGVVVFVYLLDWGVGEEFEGGGVVGGGFEEYGVLVWVGGLVLWWGGWKGGGLVELEVLDEVGGDDGGGGFYGGGRGDGGFGGCGIEVVVGDCEV